MPNKEIPAFESNEEERIFWGRSDASEYFDLSKAVLVSIPSLRSTHEVKVSPPLKNSTDSHGR
jgi:hypothetical protein